MLFCKTDDSDYSLKYGVTCKKLVMYVQTDLEMTKVVLI